MNYKDLKEYVLSDYKRAKILFDLSNCYFEDTVMIDQIDEIDAMDRAEGIEAYNRMGSIIQNDNNVMFPAKVSFALIPAFKGDEAEYNITRNGVTAAIFYADELEVHIELSEFGKKCSKIAENAITGSSISRAVTNYDYIKIIDEVFRTNIIPQ